MEVCAQDMPYTVSSAVILSLNAIMLLLSSARNLRSAQQCCFMDAITSRAIGCIIGIILRGQNLYNDETIVKVSMLFLG
jgi:hypothetical protein